MSNKTLLTNEELELTQKLQLHFPRGVIAADILKRWNGCPASLITDRLQKVFSIEPETNIVITPESLLELLGTVIVPATTKKMVVRGYVEKIRKTRKLYTGSNFEKVFFSKDIEPIGKSTLHYHKLRKGSVDKLILTELGGNDKAETTLAEMFGSMELQPNGEAGALITNGCANIFYIRDVAGVLWAVYCHWDDDGWLVLAHSVENPYELLAGDQVFSRNSLET